jgi:copper homeostasis protein
MEVLLEIIAFDINSCQLIEKAGGGRIELCANPPEGGTTVSYGMMRAAREAVQIPVFPIIRPRGGDFLYSPEEIEVMKSDIQLARDLGMDGVVLGCLKPNGVVDYELTARLVELAYPMEVTFHRAFDQVPDQLEALETVIKAGCQRILTSGGANTVMDGLSSLLACIKAAQERIIILPGAGIRSGNIARLQQLTGLNEFHSSARKITQGSMEYKNPSLTEGAQTWTVDTAEINALLAQFQ